jgi:hypothetical protein
MRALIAEWAGAVYALAIVAGSGVLSLVVPGVSWWAAFWIVAFTPLYGVIARAIIAELIEDL